MRACVRESYGTAHIERHGKSARREEGEAREHEISSGRAGTYAAA
jgi:hypothetical protein